MDVGGMTTTGAPDHQENDNCNTEMTRDPKLLCCLTVVLFIIACILFPVGASEMSTAAEYEDTSTKETCTMVDFEQISCSYQCYCTGTGTKKRCSTCSGYKYLYHATAESKCGNQTLFMNEGDLGSCPETLKQMGSQSTCYVLDCEEEEFSFTSSSTRTAKAVAMFAVAALCMTIALCGCGRLIFVKFSSGD